MIVPSHNVGELISEFRITDESKRIDKSRGNGNISNSELVSNHEGSGLQLAINGS
jgi:hypothetical protein